MSPDRAHRLWRHAGLQVPRRRPRRRVATGRPRPRPPTARNHVWAYDFVFDTCANRQTLTCLTIVDEWTRECLAIDVAGGIRSGRVIEVLAPLVSVHGAPRHRRTACYEQIVKALGAVGPSNRGTDTGSGSVEPAHRASSGLIPEERRVPGGSTSSCLRREGLRTTVGMASSPVGAGASGFYAAIDSSLHTWSASNAVRFLTTANAQCSSLVMQAPIACIGGRGRVTRCVRRS